MKKLIALTAAALMLCTVSCSESKNENGISEPVGASDKAEDTENASAERGFAVYAPEDFREINVQVSRQTEQPPIGITEYDISFMDYEPMLPACLQEVIDRGVTEEEVQEHFYFGDPEDLKKPSVGSMNAIVYGGGAVYMSVNYDSWCRETESHGARIYKGDLSKKTCEAVFESNSLDDPCFVYCMKYVNGSLWAMLTKGIFDDETRLARLNEETGEFEFADFHRIGSQYDWISDENTASSEESFVIQSSSDGHLEYSEYNTVTGEVSLIGTVEKWQNSTSLVHRGVLYVCENEEDGGTVVKSDNIELHTGLRAAQLVSVTDTMISLKVNSGGEMLYCYDLEKNERYELKTSGMGIPITGIGKGFLLNQGSRTATYIIPELGASFLMASVENSLQIEVMGDTAALFLNPGKSYDGDFMQSGENADKSKKVIIIKEK